MSNLVNNNSSVKKRKIAQSWFRNKKRLPISTNYDLRETSHLREISINILYTQYKKHFVKEPLNFLDVGCGFGESIKYAYDNWPHVNFVGIDTSKKSIKHAQNKYSFAKFINIDAQKYTESKRKFDIVLVHLNFGLWKYPFKGLENLITLMSDNSILYLVDLDKNSKENGLISAASKEEKKYLIDQYNAAFSFEELDEMLSLVANRNDEIEYQIGTGTLGGFQFDSLDFMHAINNSNIQNSLKNMSENNIKKSEISSVPGLLHGWIKKESKF